MCERTVVLDNGSGSIYAGFAEEEDPLIVLPNLSSSTKSGVSSQNFIDFSDPQKYHQFVNEVKNGELKVRYPMEHGVIVDWESMEALWDFTFNAINAKPEECNLLITEPTMNPKSNREKMAQVLFENFNFPALSVSQSAILPLYSAGLTTGVVLDCGDGVIQTVPVWGGYPISEAIQKANFGGRDVTKFLGRLLQEQGYALKSFEVLKYIKENIAIVAEKENFENPEITEFKLPDGEVIKLGAERYQCAELLFDPSLLQENDKGGVTEMLHKSIVKTNIDSRKDLYGSIVVSGGSTLIPGFVERLSKEIAALLPQKARLIIRAPPERSLSTWRGASVLASLSSFQRLLISKQEFEEVGPSIMHKHK